jgi:hypothetical protein
MLLPLPNTPKVPATWSEEPEAPCRIEVEVMTVTALGPPLAANHPSLLPSSKL